MDLDIKSTPEPYQLPVGYKTPIITDVLFSEKVRFRIGSVQDMTEILDLWFC